MSTLRIEFDRPSAVYYAGEVVSGTLTVTPSNDETCRSLLLSMVGKSKVHWHKGSGKDRRDYDGNKIFVWQERTLWGNYYRTVLLDGAGESAKFGGAVGDGDMYIPCLPTEGINGGQMKLIVRVCDYDWGRKDDNLGEIVFDAKELALKNDAVTFNLTRNGKPEQGTVTIAAQFLPTSSITPDSRGGHNKQVSSLQSKETLILKVLETDGLRKADWIGKNDVYVQAWKAPETMQFPPPSKKKLPEPNMKITLPNGSTQFKFAFPTRADSPGSAIFNAGDHAYIAYYILAKIDKKAWKNKFLKAPLVILPSRPVPMPQLLAPGSEEITPMPIYKTKICCFSCGDAGKVKAKLSVDRRAYAPGETVRLNGSTLENDSTIPVTARIVLRQIVRLCTTGAVHNTHEKVFRSELGSIEVEPQSSAQLENLKVVIPAVSPSFFGAKGLVTSKREALTFTYVLSLQGKATSGHKVKVEIPILISALPPLANAVSKATSMTSPKIVDPFQLHTFAVTDDAPSSTVTIITGVEDTGGVVTPAAGEGGSIWEKEDDSGSSNQSYIYKPQVILFSSDVDDFKQNPVLGVGHTTAFNELQQQNNVDDHQQNPVPEVDHTTAFNELLSSMDTEYDSRLAVDKWIKQQPLAAASLTVDEFAIALKKVLFSLDQPAVARELSSGLGSGKLTTKYILAAMEACPFSKSALATALAPYVSDPENKEGVLLKLTSYERMEAKNAFVS